MKKQHSMNTRKSMSDNSLAELRAGFVLLPYHLARAAAAAKNLIEKAIDWLTTEH